MERKTTLRPKTAAFLGISRIVFVLYRRASDPETFCNQLKLNGHFPLAYVPVPLLLKPQKKRTMIVKHIRFACILLTLSLAVAAPQAASTVIRTLVYHEISSLPQSPIARVGGTSQVGPILNKNGNRAAFSIQTGSNEFHIWVINSDGTGLQEVDSYTNINAAPFVDINVDGSKVLSSDGARIRLVNADGSNAHDVVRIDGGFIQIRLSADGMRVFFTVDRDFMVGTENPTAGLYVINADGNDRRQIVSAAQIQTSVGAPVDFVIATGTTLDVSADILHIIFGTGIHGRGYYLLGVNNDGGGLHQILGPVDFVNHAAISGDGRKVAYDTTSPPCCSTPGEAGVINFDGTEKKSLVTNVSPFPSAFYPGTADPMQLSGDGSRLLLGVGVLFTTATGEALQLAARGGSFSTDSAFLVNEGMLAATMNNDATRVLYLSGDANNVNQLAILDLNPGSLGPSPSVTDPQIDPTFVIIQQRNFATLSAKVSTTSTIVRVNNAVLFKGLSDANAFNGLTDTHVSSLVLLDDGTSGDTAANDGIFTNNRLASDCCAVLGPRLVRVKAEVRASDGKRHATAIDFEPLTVTDEAPSIDVSQTSLDFGSVIVGQSKDLTLTIRNIGASPLTVNSLTSDNSQFSVPTPTAPLTLPPGGQQTVTVHFTPNAVGPQGGRLTITSTDPARPSIVVFLSGVGITTTTSFTVNDHRVTGDQLGPNAPCNPPPTLKSTFVPTDAVVFQWTSVSGFQNEAVLRWEWIQPNGSIYENHPKQPANNPNSDVCFNDAITIAGTPAASLPGNWQVRVFYNGSLIATDNFTISGGGGGGGTQSRLCRLELSTLFGAGQALGAVWARAACPSEPDPLAPTTVTALQTTLQNVLAALDLIPCIGFDRSRVTGLSARFPGMPKAQAVQEIQQLIVDLQQAVRQTITTCDQGIDLESLLVTGVHLAAARVWAVCYSGCPATPVPTDIQQVIRDHLATAKAALLRYQGCIPRFDFNLFDSVPFGSATAGETAGIIGGVELQVLYHVTLSDCCCNCQAPGPRLAIQPVISQGSILIDLPADAMNFVVQSADNVPTTNWSNITITTRPTNGPSMLLQPIAGPRKFYRLMKP
jgi:hypothetical protein